MVDTPPHVHLPMALVSTPATPAAPAELPVEIWLQVMQRLPQAQRLRSGLVSSTLHRAAVAATRSLEVNTRFGTNEEERAEGAMRYLQNPQLGGSLTSLKLCSSAPMEFSHLPCPQLLELDMHGWGRGFDATPPVVLQLGPQPDGLPGALGIATGLTRLKLSSCAVTSTSNTTHPLAHLSALVNLQSVKLSDVAVRRGGHVVVKRGFDSEMVDTFPGTVFPFLQQLSHLRLEHVGFEDVHCISSATSLRELRLALSFDSHTSIRPPVAFPSSLHTLTLKGEGVSLHPSVLSTASQCTLLDLHGVGLGSMSGNGATFVAAMPALQQLAVLKLQDLYFDWPPLAGAAGAAQYTALVSSSQLRELTVRKCELPYGAWEHVFAGPGVLGTLTKLLVYEKLSRRRDDYWRAPAVLNLVRRCPQLVDVDFDIKGARSVAALEPLAASLTCLRARDGGSDVVSRAKRLAALTNLRTLRFTLQNSVPRIGLLALTSLRELHTLYLGRGYSGQHFYNKVGRDVDAVCAWMCNGQP